MNHIEQAYRAMEAHRSQAYKAWRATLPPIAIIGRDPIVQEIVSKMYGEPRKYASTGRWRRTPEHREIARKAALKRWATPSKRARHAVASYWATLTPEQRSERQRKAAKKMWKRRKAEALRMGP